MTDIDIWQKEPGIFLISWNPCDGHCILYEIEDCEIRKLTRMGMEGETA